MIHIYLVLSFTNIYNKKDIMKQNVVYNFKLKSYDIMVTVANLCPIILRLMRKVIIKDKNISGSNVY